MSTRINDIEEQEEILQNDNVIVNDDVDVDVDDNDDDDDDNNESVRKPSSRRRLMSSLLNDTDINATSLKELLSSIDLNGEWFRRNMRFFFVIIFCLMVFVTNRYQAQQEMIEEADLKSELEEMNYTWLTRFSELTTASRQSQIEERLKQLGDSTLTHSKEAPVIIKADK